MFSLHWVNSILAAKLHFGIWCPQTSTLGSICTCLYTRGGFGKQNKTKLIHLLHLSHFFWPKSLMELMKDLKPNAALKLDAANGSKSHFHQLINPIIALCVPQITAISFWRAALHTFHSPLTVTQVKLMYLDRWALPCSSLLSTLHWAQNWSFFPSCCGDTWGCGRTTLKGRSAMYPQPTHPSCVSSLGPFRPYAGIHY